MVDDITTYLYASVPSNRWLTLNEGLAQSVRQLQLDALVFGDLFMDSFVTHLAMFRLAPIQVAFWGHPFTSGFPSMDYFITSELVRFDSLSFQMYPPEQRDRNIRKEDFQKQNEFQWCGCESFGNDVKVENPLMKNRLETLNTVILNGYNLENNPIKVTNFLRHFRASLSCQAKAKTVSDGNECVQMLLNMHLYGCLQSLMKMHPLFDRAIIQLLVQDPKAIVLLLRNSKQSAWQDSQRRRLQTLVSIEEQKLKILTNDTTSNLHLADRLVFMDQMSHERYIQLLCGVDVSLDPFPFGGGVTLSDSSGGSCGRFGAKNVPFITCASLQSVHRIGAGLAHSFNSTILARNSCQSMYLHDSGNSKQMNERELCLPGSLQCRVANIGRMMQHSIDSYVKGAIELCIEGIHVKFEQIEPILSTDYMDIHKCDKPSREWEQFLMRIT
eukprot:CAMPEP_0170103430 /NCGR_PEP_ID=MMETSP0020_2-20130122/3490_1 /TAXON_ID=98059 /ORGANISM="Dinobryon sp., Strain UTEXLB2267" /LENGTH=441 /DNA_ID=CAMNT_0010326997 /DNA_START=616 /DNA_END=1941 /DNA_ORIENTATION=+